MPLTNVNLATGLEIVDTSYIYKIKANDKADKKEEGCLI